MVASTSVLLCFNSCARREKGDGLKTTPRSDVSQKDEALDTTVKSDVSQKEEQAIMQELERWDLPVDTSMVEGIKRLSVDSFSVTVDGIECIVSLREDRIITRGDLSTSEIASIKEEANQQREYPQFDISSIEQTSPNAVEVTTGDFGTATGEIIRLERSDGIWTVKSVATWVE